MLSEMGINVIEADEVEEAEEGDDEPEGGELAEAQPTAVATKPAKEPTDRTDDPVRMYLREMGSVELLSREGEIAIAKRIEAGRETMIAGLCESPAHLPGHHHLARRARRREDPAARHHRPRGHLCRPRRQGRARRARRGRGRRAGARRASNGARPGQKAPPMAPSGDDEVDEVEAERARLAAGGGRRGRLRERPVARRDGGRAEAAGGRDLRDRRRRLQEAPPPAGPGRRVQAEEHDALALARSAATRSSRTRSSRR